MLMGIAMGSRKKAPVADVAWPSGAANVNTAVHN